MTGQQSLLALDIEPAVEVPQTPYERIRYWVEERERMRIKKESGHPGPWTDHPILAKYRFCNVHRKDDRVSRWILQHIIAPYADHPNLWLMLAIARWVNWPPTLQELMTEEAWPIGEPDWKRMASIVDARQQRDDKAWTGAYRIRADNQPSSPYYQLGKGRLVFCHYLGEALWTRRPQIEVALRTRRQQDVHRVFTSLYGRGSFMTGQVVADYTWTPLLKEAIDLYTWAPLGPGSRHGLNRLAGRPLEKKMSDTVLVREMIALRQRLIVDVPWVETCTLMDTQNICCEGDKFLRTLNGEEAPKTLYRPETAY